MLNKKVLLLLIAAVLLAAGLGAYQYRAPLYLYFNFKPANDFSEATVPPAPDYSQTTSWLALPESEDYADIAPVGQTDNQATADADVFFVHPTTFLSKANWNAAIDDPSIKTRTEIGVLKHQASAFNACCKIYAPRYRQATFYFNMSLDNDNGRQASELAYRDVERAFQHYLNHYNQGRPFIIASHSQGSRYGLRLLEEYVNNKPLQRKLVAAYIIGLGVPMDKFSSTLNTLHPCAKEDDTGCVVSYTTMEENFPPGRFQYQLIHYPDGYQSNQTKELSCVNPLNWRSDESRANYDNHVGAIGVNLVTKAIENIQSKLVEGACGRGMFYISQPSKPDFRATGLTPGDYHVLDYSLFYMNIRQNAQQRLSAYVGSSEQ